MAKESAVRTLPTRLMSRGPISVSISCLEIWKEAPLQLNTMMLPFSWISGTATACTSVLQFPKLMQ